MICSVEMRTLQKLVDNLKSFDCGQKFGLDEGQSDTRSTYGWKVGGKNGPDKNWLNPKTILAIKDEELVYKMAKVVEVPISNDHLWVDWVKQSLKFVNNEN